MRYYIAPVINGFAWGIITGILGFHITDWQFWLLILAGVLSLMLGQINEHSATTTP
jgi:hypothetical protein